MKDRSAGGLAGDGDGAGAEGGSAGEVAEGGAGAAAGVVDAAGDETRLLLIR